jgi:integrase/recombinase XerD
MRDNAIVDRWLAFKEHNQGRSPATAGKYRGYLVRLAIHLQQQHGKQLIEAERQDLEHFAGLFMHQARLSPRSRRALVASIRGFYGWLKRDGLIRIDPAKELAYPNAGFRLPVGASLRTAEQLLMAPDLSSFSGIRDAAMIAIMIGCGVRLSGLCALNESSLLWIHDAGKERLILKVREKGGKERLVPAPPEVRLLIRAYRGHEELEGIDRLLEDGDRVLFVSIRNRRIPAHLYRGEERRMSPRAAEKMVYQYGRKQGLDPKQLHPHALRHLFGTELAESDVDIVKIQALMGHADPKTSRIYIQLATQKLSKVVDSMGPLSKMRTPVTDLARRLE